MALVDELGPSTNTALNVTYTYTHVPGSAETRVRVYKGNPTVAEAKYEELKAAGVNVVLDVNHGVGTVTETLVFDPSVDDVDNKSYWAYELVPVEVLRDIQNHPYFLEGGTIDGTDTGAAVSPDNLKKVAVEFERLGIVEEGGKTASALKTEWSTTPGSVEGEKMVLLLQYYISGTMQYPSSEFILRETKEVSLEALDRVDYSHTSRVVNPPNAKEVNVLIGNLPTGEWLKRAPQVSRLSLTRWQIVTEWWWAVKWAKIYGGTFYGSVIT